MSFKKIAIELRPCYTCIHKYKEFNEGPCNDCLIDQNNPFRNHEDIK